MAGSLGRPPVDLAADVTADDRSYPRAIRPICPVPRGQRESYAAGAPTVKSAGFGVDHIVTRAWRVATCQSDTVLRAFRPLAEDALLSMLFPLWQLVIAVVVLIVMTIAVWRLARRGRSRMTTAVVVTAVVVVGINALAVLLSDL
jgi:hypothetical protein